MSGWICLHKKITEWEWYSDINCFRLFIHLLLKANYQSAMFCGIEIKRGQLAISRSTLTAQTGLTEKQIRLVEKKLENGRSLGVKKTNGFMIYTIEKYNDYQEQEIKKANKGQTKGKQRAEEGQHITIEQETNNKDIILISMPFDILPAEWKDWAIKENNFDAAHLEDIFSVFKEYWKNGKGKTTKRECWLATWRNWIRNQKPQQKGNKNETNRNNNQPARSWTEAGNNLASKLQREIDELEREADRLEHEEKTGNDGFNQPSLCFAENIR